MFNQYIVIVARCLFNDVVSVYNCAPEKCQVDGDADEDGGEISFPANPPIECAERIPMSEKKAQAGGFPFVTSIRSETAITNEKLKSFFVLSFRILFQVYIQLIISKLALLSLNLQGKEI